MKVVQRDALWGERKLEQRAVLSAALKGVLWVEMSAALSAAAS